MFSRQYSKRCTSFSIAAQANVEKAKTNVEVFKQRGSLWKNERALFQYRFPIHLWMDATEENQIVRRYIGYLRYTLAVQTIAILWNVFLVWDPRSPTVWVTNWQTITSKSIISATCVMLTILTYYIRKIDQNQLPAEERGMDFQLASELMFIMIHVPPFSFGLIGAENDVWNIMGTSKLYLLTETLKVNHPFWLRRYEINTARMEESNSSHIVGTQFCVIQTLTKLDSTFIFISFAMLFLSIFTSWIYVVERVHEKFDVWIMIDHVLSSFFKVRPANHGALQTITGRNIKMLVGFFSMFYAAIVGWTFGFRVTENKQFLEDMLNDLNENLKLQDKNARAIQKWWREVCKAKENNEVPKRKRIRRGVVWKLIKPLQGFRGNLDCVTAARRDLSEVRITTRELKKSNERLSRSHQEMINSVLVLVGAKG